ncbi:MAG: hypothetical protein MR695_10045 [Solobacterium sp.]|nr:hypothetical protein [Solobacterium sp.]
MNKLEYIPGDLVIYTSLFKEPIAEICEVHETSYTIKFMHGNSVIVENREIKPIPITIEILEKNGWKIEDVNPHDLSDIVSKGIIYRAIKGKEILFFQKGASVFTCPLNWRKIEIRYVHELQHLLFGLKLNSEMEI